MGPSSYLTIHCEQTEVYPDFSQIEKLLIEIVSYSESSGVELAKLCESLMDLHTILRLLPFHPNKLIVLLFSRYNIISVLTKLLLSYGNHECTLPIIEAKGTIDDVIRAMLQMYSRVTTYFKPSVSDILMILACSDDSQVVKDSINAIKKLMDTQDVDLQNFYIYVATKIKLETNMKSLNSMLEILITLIEETDKFPAAAVDICSKEAKNRLISIQKDQTTRKTCRLLKSLIEISSYSY